MNILSINSKYSWHFAIVEVLKCFSFIFDKYSEYEHEYTNMHYKIERDACCELVGNSKIVCVIEVG